MQQQLRDKQSTPIKSTLRAQLSLMLVAISISMLLIMVIDVNGEPLVGTTGGNGSNKDIGDMLDTNIIRILNDIMEIKSSENLNHTSGKSIFFDKSRKLVFFPTRDDSVHKFHPNGRYGRRSLPPGTGESASAHSELGAQRSSRTPRDGPLRQLLLARNGLSANNLENVVYDADTNMAKSMNGLTNEMELGSFQQELNKILKCDYAGISNLYYCDN